MGIAALYPSCGLNRPGMTGREIFPVIASASEAIHLATKQMWIASSLSLLAMTNSTRLICPDAQISRVPQNPAQSQGKTTKRPRD